MCAEKGWMMRHGVGAALIGGVLTVLSPWGGLAEEPVPIRDVLADPEAYHLHQVTIEGVVASVRELDPYILPSGTACYGAYTFLLEADEQDQGLLSVAVLGLCGPPRLRHPEVAEGDKVTVRADIHVTSRFGEARDVVGMPLPRGDQPVVQAVARTIARRAE